MTQEPLRVEPVEMEYYQNEHTTTIRVMRFVSLVAIIYGASILLSTSLDAAGIAMALDWYRTSPPSYISQTLVALIMSLVLVLSGIGCLSYRPLARKGILLYSIVVLALTAVTVGVQSVTGLSSKGAQTPSETLYMLVGYASAAIHGSALPAILFMVFRLKEVERAFDEGRERRIEPATAMEVPR